MRTKTLFLSAAALVAGLASSVAQSNVYSVNVVGYVNVPLTAGQFALLANPLDNGTNDLASLGAALPNKTTVQVWTGSGFTGSQKVSGAWGTNLPIPPGTGFFVQTPDTAAGNVTNTFVGSVVIGFGQTNVMNLTEGFSLVGSPVPFAGTLNDAGANTLNLGGSLPNKSTVQTWDGTGFTGSQKVAGTWGANLSIGVAEGFFVNLPAGTTANWSQVLE